MSNNTTWRIEFARAGRKEGTKMDVRMESGFLVRLYPDQIYRQMTKPERRAKEALIAERDRLFNDGHSIGQGSVYAVHGLSPDRHDFIQRWHEAGHDAAIIEVPAGYHAHCVVSPDKWLIYKNGSSETLPLKWKQYAKV